MYDLLKKVLRTHVNAPDDEVETILQYFRIRSFKKNDMILNEGTVCKELLFINKGMIRTFVYHEGEDITTWVALPETIETVARSFLQQTPSGFNLQA